MDNDRLLQAMLTIPSVEEAKISPDRRWVAFAWYRVSAQIDIFVAPTDGAAAPIQLTATPDETQLIAWAPTRKV
ncbi:MAG: hypothetical protein HC822_19050 [Oscillochloris sp.]|nr:hypothetical protein [Oscillochloris sp.]